MPTNCKALSTFRHYVMDLWRRALQRRSQRDRSTWERIAQLAREFLPQARILHPWPSERFAVNYPSGSPVRESRTPGSVRGVLSNKHPYRDSGIEERGADFAGPKPLFERFGQPDVVAISS
jgi:RNA-directed DNA polymerase